MTGAFKEQTYQITLPNGAKIFFRNMKEVAFATGICKTKLYNRLADNGRIEELDAILSKVCVERLAGRRKCKRTETACVA